MLPPSAPVELPQSYAKLNLPHIQISHVPESSPEPTQVLVLTLYRPNNNNAFTKQMQESITSFYELVNADERVKVVVLTGKAYLQITTKLTIKAPEKCSALEPILILASWVVQQEMVQSLTQRLNVISTIEMGK